jgi:hypothetical protein
MQVGSLKVVGEKVDGIEVFWENVLELQVYLNPRLNSTSRILEISRW